MDEEGIGIIALVLIVVGLAVGGMAAWAGILYATDAPVGAVVIEKQCASFPGGGSSTVTVLTKFPIPGIEHTLTDMDNVVCNGLRADADDGSFAEYHVQSGRTILYEREGGRCLYDSAGLVC